MNFRRLILTLAVLSGAILLSQEIKFSNSSLEVTFIPATGRYSVLDKRIGRLWTQPLKPLQFGGPIRKLNLKADKPMEIPITKRINVPNNALKDDKDCKANATVKAQNGQLIINVNIVDDKLAFPVLDQEWWHYDSVEFWIGSGQYAAYPKLDETTPILDRTRKPLQKSTAKTTKTQDGYLVEITIDAEEFKLDLTAGKTFGFAIGVNDADQPAQRKGQLYYPDTWQHSNPATFATILIGNDDAIPDKLPSKDACVNVEKINNGITYTWIQEGHPIVNVKATLTDNLPELKFELAAQKPDEKMAKNYPDIIGFVHDDIDAAIACADYSSGHLYPLREEPCPIGGITLAADLPFVAINSIKTGVGYGIIAETSDDATLTLAKLELNDKETTRIPQVHWLPTKGTFGAKPRIYRYCFIDKGGYVAVTKIWRKWAKENGYLVTLKEKAKHNPNVLKLMGASDTWNGNNLKFLKLAKSYGIDKLLVNGGFNPKDMEVANEMGYLLGRYDVYTDIYNNTDKIDSMSGLLPGHAVRKADGTTMKAWTTFDGSRTSWKRCTAKILEACKIVVPRDLEKYPYQARFLDVTTAEGLYECYHPDHPMTRTDKRKYSEEVGRYWANWELGNLNLVTGGEHGKWWCARDMHYLEGMQSGGHANYSWPAGHLKAPKTKDDNPWKEGTKTDRFYKRYLVYGVGPKYRIPFWDLALHDCITTTWYWGDSTDFLLDAAPEVTPRKDAFNILQASMPMFWINKGTWTRDRSSFLRSYFHTTKIHELVGMEEMLDHQFLNEERTIHKTTFTGGYQIIVNFDDAPQDVTLNGKTYKLAPNGFAAEGPGLHQTMVVKDDNLYYSQVVSDNLYFATKAIDANPRLDGTSSTLAIVTVKKEGSDTLRVSITGDNSLPIHKSFLKNWDWKTTAVFKLDEEGRRTGNISWKLKDDSLVLPEAGNYDVLCRKEADHPDYQVELIPTPGENDVLLVKLTNNAFGNEPVTVGYYADRIAPETLKSFSKVDKLGHGKSVMIELQIVPDQYAGTHRLIVMASTQNDLIPENNRVDKVVQFPYVPNNWLVKINVETKPLAVNSRLHPTEQKIDLATPQGTSINPDSVRVVDLQQDPPAFCKYAQFVPDPDFDGKTNMKGTICFSYDAVANKAHRFLVVASPRKLAPLNKPVMLDTTTDGVATYITDDYELGFREATIMDLKPGVTYGGGPDFINAIIVSSAATGWASETDAKINEFKILLNGPAKSIVVADKTLRTGMRYTKTYTLYPGRFTVEFKTDKPTGGLFSRGFYPIPGIYMDDKGNTVDMATAKDDAGVSGKNPDPKWYAVRGKGWAHSCIAMSKFSNMSFWDPIGQIGFSSANSDDVRVAYFVYGDQPDFSFAEQDWLRTR